MAHRNLHQQLPVVLASSSTNFVRVPRSFATSIRSAFPAKAHGVIALRIGWLAPPSVDSGGVAKPCQAFVGWTEQTADGHYIQIPQGLAESLGLSEAVEASQVLAPDTPLVVSVAVVPYAPIAARVDVDPVSADDWDILQLHANLVEEELLGQICVLGPGQRFPMWVHGHTRINLQVSGISLVEQGQAMCVRLARNTEVVVAPKLRAKEDSLKAQSLRRRENEKSHGALGYQLRVQPPDPADSDTRQEDLNCTALVNPGLLGRLSRAAKWPVLKAGDNGVVVYDDSDPVAQKVVVAVVSNTRRAKILAKSAKSPKSARLVPKQGLMSAVNQIPVRLRASRDVAPGHIILPKSVQAVCKLQNLGSMVLSLPFFDPIECPQSFPALSVHLTLISGQQEEGRAPINVQAAREAALAAQQWQKRAAGLEGLPLSDGGVVVLGGKHFYVSIDDGGGGSSNSSKGRAEERAGSESPGNGNGKTKPRHKPPSAAAPWLVKVDSKVEWLVNKYSVDLSLRKRGASDSAGVAADASQQPAEPSSSSSALSNGLMSYNDDFFSGPRLADLPSVETQAAEILDRLHPVLGSSASRKRLAVGAPHPGGVCLCGGRGLGKSTLAKAVARKLRCESSSLVHTVWVACANLRGGKRSEVESTISSAFKEALAYAPSLIIFDDLDLLLPAPAGGGEDGAGGDGQLIWLAEWLEDLLYQYQRKLESFERNEVAAAADHADAPGAEKRHCTFHALSWLATGMEKNSMRKSLLRPGLFDKTVELQPLTAHDRAVVLSSMVAARLGPHAGLLSPLLQLDEVAATAEGYAPADLDTLVERAVHSAFVRMIKQGVREKRSQAEEQVQQNGKEGEEGGEELGWEDNLGGVDGGKRRDPREELAKQLVPQDFEDALDGFTPFALRGVALAKSDVKWSDVGGLLTVRRVLKDTLELPIRFAPLYERCPQRLASGVLLYGPPGCGKTLLAGAVAKECGLNFISVKGPEVLNKYIGASEQAVRDLFARGAAAAPCIVFFDEFDAVAPRRGNDSSGVTDRVVNQLLTFLDGVESRSGVYVMAATSRPDLVDPALLRPGRLDKQLLCGFPDAEERADILKTVASKMDFATDSLAMLDTVARSPQAELFTGADLQALLYSAQLDSIHSSGGQDPATEDDESGPTASQVLPRHLHKALQEARASVSKEERARYNQIYETFKGDRGADFDAVSGYSDGKQRTALK